MTVLAGVATAVAAALLVPAAVRLPVSGRRPRRLPLPLLLVSTAVLAGALVTAAKGSTLVLGLIVLASVAAASRLVSRARRRKVAEASRTMVVELCQALAGELRAGQPPVAALSRCAESWPPFESVAVAARLGADVPTALRRLAETPGAEGLRDVAGAWQVSLGTGSGLSAALDRVAASARREQSVRRLVAAELASAQATARLVATLPVLALLMGSGVGGDPWGFLLGSPAGLACLGCGLVLVFAGLGWLERIADGVAGR